MPHPFALPGAGGCGTGFRHCRGGRNGGRRRLGWRRDDKTRPDCSAAGHRGNFSRAAIWTIATSTSEKVAHARPSRAWGSVTLPTARITPSPGIRRPVRTDSLWLFFLQHGHGPRGLEVGCPCVPRLIRVSA